MSPGDTRIRGEIYPVSIAPMMDRTDRHFRYFLRLLTRHSLLYTEMVATGTLIHGDVEQHLGYSPEEHPLALQLGGDDPGELEHCARLGVEWGYDEINLNVGCPSDRVQHRNFGACLMATPERVADCVSAMREAVPVPVTVKHRIGIDDRDSYDDLAAFVTRVAPAGCDRFIVHARTAILSGLSPKQNRTIPPLRYELVHRLKRDFPHLRIEINGGIRDLAGADEQLRHVDGVMIGRAAYDDPFVLRDTDERFFDAPPDGSTRQDVLEKMADYCAEQLRQGVPLARTTRVMIGLYTARPGSRRFRQFLNDRLFRSSATEGDLSDLLELTRQTQKEAHRTPSS